MQRVMTVYECRFTGLRLFDKESFKQHLLSLRSYQQNRRWRRRMEAKIAAFKLEAYSAEQISKWIASNIADLCRLANSGKPNKVSFKFGSVVLNKESSGYSYQPLGKNSSSKDNLSQYGYPQWPAYEFRGLSIKYSSCKNFEYRRILQLFNIGTGCGSGDSNSFYYHDAVLWQSEWPSLEIK